MSEFRGVTSEDAAERSYLRPVWPRSYVSAPKIPKWFIKALNCKGGYNPLAQPNFKLVWGMDERTWCGDDPRAIKYVNPNDVELGWACYIVERWAPPSFYNREEFETLFPHRPFPTKGIYIQCAILATEGPDGLPYEALPLEQRVLDELLGRLTYGPVKPNEQLALRQLEKEKRQEKARRTLRAALDANFEYHRRKAELINALASRHTVIPSVGLPIKTQIDELNTGVSNANRTASA